MDIQGQKEWKNLLKNKQNEYHDEHKEEIGVTMTTGGQRKALPMHIQCLLMERLYNNVSNPEIDVEKVLFTKNVMYNPGWLIDPIKPDINDQLIFANINHRATENNLPNCFKRIKKLPFNPLQASFRELCEYAPKLLKPGRKTADIGISRNKRTLGKDEVEAINDMFFKDSDVFKDNSNDEWCADARYMGMTMAVMLFEEFDLHEIAFMERDDEEKNPGLAYQMYKYLRSIDTEQLYWNLFVRPFYQKKREKTNVRERYNQFLKEEKVKEMVKDAIKGNNTFDGVYDDIFEDNDDIDTSNDVNDDNRENNIDGENQENIVEDGASEILNRFNMLQDSQRNDVIKDVLDGEEEENFNFEEDDLGLFVNLQNNHDLNNLDTEKANNFGTFGLSEKEAVNFQNNINIADMNDIESEDELIDESYGNPRKVRNYKVNRNKNVRDRKKQIQRNEMYLQQKANNFRELRYERIGLNNDEQKMQNIQRLMMSSTVKIPRNSNGESQKKRRRLDDEYI